jgi:hypothetical protein
MIEFSYKIFLLYKDQQYFFCYIDYINKDYSFVNLRERFIFRVNNDSFGSI